MTKALRWTEEDLAAFEQRKKTAGVGASERAVSGRVSAPAPAVLWAIGIDPGVKTGLAVWDVMAMHFERIESMSIVRAMREVAAIKAARRDGELFVMFEDARKRKVFNAADDRSKKPGVREGVGSVKRDSAIWEEFLLDLGVPYKARAPMATKWSADQFRRTTKWERQTSEHARDAGMIVYGLNAPMVLSMMTHYRQAIEAGRKP